MRLILPVLALVAACDTPPPVEIGPEFDAQAIAFLDDLQPRSIRENREYCGYVGLDGNGNFRATDPVAGGPESCKLPLRPSGFGVAASYHTHSAFDTAIDSEVPSSDDVRSDIADQVFGYISTPGGRVWLVDWRDRSATQLCGIGCVFGDPRFVRGDAGPIAQRYTLSELRQRER